MHYLRITFFAFMALISVTTSSFGWSGKVVRVVDGDTIEINYHGKLEKIRLLNVFTPESVHRDKKLAEIYRQKIIEWKQSFLEGKAKLEALAGVYVGNSKSLKLHKPDCRWAKSVSDKNKVVFKSKQDALDAGYAPCKVGKP